MKQIFTYQNLLFFIPLFIISSISLIDMYYIKELSDLYQYHLVKELLWLLIGFSLIIIIHYINLHQILKLSPYLYYFSLLLLILVLFIGTNTNGSSAWFKIGIFKIQPSEIMKLSLILYLNYINNKSEVIYLLRLVILTLVPSILVFLEPDTGAIIIYGLILLSVIFSKNIKKAIKITILIMLLICLGIFVFLIIYQPAYLIRILGSTFTYRLNRIINLKNGYQIDNALTAIGSSRPFNIMVTNPILYIPEAPTDFIFAFTVGNLGFITGFILIINYFLITLFLINKKHLIKNSLLTIFLFQVIYNLGFNLGMLPIMGIPLPFLSYGGSNIIIYFMMFAILFSKDGNSNYNRKNNQGYKGQHYSKALG